MYLSVVDMVILQAEVKKDKQNPDNVNKVLNNAPEHTGNLFVRYLPTEKLYGEVGVTYVGDYTTLIAI